MRKDLIEKLAQVQRIAEQSKWQRLSGRPLRYLSAIGYRQLVYPYTHKGWQQTARTFFGREMRVVLPAGTDIYLTGGKSHLSEIRLARFLIERLRPGDHFLDVGAHVGYFSLLAAELVGPSGRVKSYEPAEDTFSLLAHNVAGLGQVEAVQQAVSYSDQPLVFYEFPPLYSEYNSSDVSQFEEEPWYAQNPPRKREVPATSIDLQTAEGNFSPAWIKIDAEGGELSVIRGGERFLRAQSAGIVMEYLEPSRNNAPHRAAVELLSEWGYAAHTIDAEGRLIPQGNLDEHLEQEGLDSDNIVFLKPTPVAGVQP